MTETPLIDFKKLEKEDKEMALKDFNDIINNDDIVDFTPIKTALKNTHLHLRLYDEIDKMLGLEGDAYYPVKKWLCYFYESFLQGAKQIKVGSAHYDNRVHGLIIASGGKGKGVIKNIIKNTLRINKEDVIETSGIVHPEQLIGKMKEVGRGKDKHKVEARGYLSAEIVLHDETNSTINETAPNADQSMRIKRTAMDCYGFNRLSKKLVDDFMSDCLEYDSPSRCLDFMHPEQFQSCFFDKGTYRRYFCFMLGIDKDIELNDSTKNLFEDSINYEEKRKFFDDLKYITKQKFTKFEMNDDCKRIAAKWITFWNNFVLNNNKAAIRRFGEMTFYSIKDYFFKNITILHGAYGKELSEISITQLACIDTFHFLIETLENYVKYGDMANTCDVWRGAKDMEIVALEYLHNNNALDINSQVSVQKYIEVIMDLFGVQERQAKGIISKLKSRGYIVTKQTGSYSSAVWLSFKPDFHNVVPLNMTINEFWNENIEGCKGVQFEKSENNAFAGENNKECKECIVSSIHSIYLVISYYYTRINPIINKIKYSNNSLFPVKDINISDLSNSMKFGLIKNDENMTHTAHLCTPCTPEKPTLSDLSNSTETRDLLQEKREKNTSNPTNPENTATLATLKNTPESFYPDVEVIKPYNKKDKEKEDFIEEKERD